MKNPALLTSLYINVGKKGDKVEVLKALKWVSGQGVYLSGTVDGVKAVGFIKATRFDKETKTQVPLTMTDKTTGEVREFAVLEIFDAAKLDALKTAKGTATDLSGLDM